MMLSVVETESLVRTGVNHRHQFLPGHRVVTETPKQPAGDKICALLVHATACHTMMRCLDHHTGPLWLQHLLDAVSDLRCQALLNLQPFGIGLDYTSQLGDADDTL